MSSLAALSPAMRQRRAQWRLTPLPVAAALALFALAIGFINLGGRPLWLDEAYSSWFSSRGWHELWTIVPTYEPHPPLYYSLLKLWSGAIGTSPFALRSLSVLFAGATVLVAAAAALELDRQDRIRRPLLRMSIAAFLCAVSPIFIALDQLARPYAFMIFGYALATLGLARLIRELRDGPGTIASWMLLAAGTDLTLWSHSLGVLYAASLALALAPAWLRRPVDRRRMARGLAVAAVVAALYVPCLLMIASRTGDWHNSWMRWDDFNLVLLLVLCIAPVGKIGTISIVAALVLAFLTKRVVESAWLREGWTAERALLVLWWTPPLLSTAISLLYMPVFLPRTLAAAMVPAYLALAGALARAPSARERMLLAAGIATLIPAAIVETQRPAIEQWDQVSSFLARNVARGDQLWLYPNDSALPLAANRPSLGLPMRGIPGDFPAVGVSGPIRAGSPAVVSLTADKAQALARGGALEPAPVIWLVTRQSSIFDPDNDLPRALAASRRAGKARRWGYIVVQPFTRR